MITVGIQDNIRLVEALVNDKGTLVIKMQQDAGGSGNLMDLLSSNSTQTQENEQGYFFWPLQEDDRLTTVDEHYKDTVNKISVLRAQLNHFLEQYMVSSAYKWDIAAGLGLSEEKQSEELQLALSSDSTRQATLDKVYSNFITQFVGFISPFIGPTSPLFRVKFVRTSKDKHFSNIPKFAPFIEPMSVPVKSSKLRWSKFELGFKKGDPDKGPFTGLNYADGTPVVGLAASSPSTTAESNAIKNLFGPR